MSWSLMIPFHPSQSAFGLDICQKSHGTTGLYSLSNEHYDPGFQREIIDGSLS